MNKSFEIGKQIALPQDRPVRRQQVDIQVQAIEPGANRRKVSAGRRIDDGHGAGWTVAIVACLLAVAVMAVPDDWKLDPPHAQQACR